MIRSVSPALLCVLLALLLVSSVSAAPRQRPPATQDIEQVDSDFRYQGEYMGYLLEAPHSRYVEKVGLQIVARGDGKFEAVLFQGGLPGDGWNQEEADRGEAQLQDGIVQASLGDYEISVSRNTASFATNEGHSLGRLRKYDRRSRTRGMEPPPNAKVLFDGEKNDLWKNMNVTENGLLKEGCETMDTFQDFRLHLEFRLPYKPLGTSQDRGNSGVYLQRRYEVQVLDSFGDELAYNHCGAIYKVREPDQNMCLPPLSWQTYDIEFRAARFDEEGNKTENMMIRVWQNGIVIHDGIEIESKTGAGKPEGPEPLSILLQDHGNPVRYRNIWIVEKDPFAEPDTKQPTAPRYAHHGHPTYHGPVYHHGPYYGGYWPYTHRFQYAPLGPPAAYHMHPNYDSVPYPYGW